MLRLYVHYLSWWNSTMFCASLWCFRFSQWYGWKFKSSRVWHCDVGWAVYNTLKDHSPLIQGQAGLSSTHSTMQSQIPEGLCPLQHLYWASHLAYWYLPAKLLHGVNIPEDCNVDVNCMSNDMEICVSAVAQNACNQTALHSLVCDHRRNLLSLTDCHWHILCPQNPV